MNFCVVRISVFMVAAAQIWAQSNVSRSRFPQDVADQRMESFELEHGLGPLVTSGAVPVNQGESEVVSFQHLQHPRNHHADRIAKKGMREFRRGHFAEALPFFQKAVALDPKSTSYENNVGVLYCVLGEDKEAQDAFEKAIKVDSSASISYRNLASVAFNTYQYKLSEEAARRALQLTPLSPEAQIMTALSQIAQNHWTPEAKKFLTEYRASFAEADRILKVWPSPNAQGTTPKHVVAIRGAGPGAFRMAEDQDSSRH